ncbi:MAG: hypothetical protein ACTTIO_06735, partial [Candidatus Fimenecus sp.]
MNEKRIKYVNKKEAKILEKELGLQLPDLLFKISFDNKIHYFSSKVKQNNDNDEKYSKKGENKYGIEVYETSEEVKKLTWKERIKQYKNLMENMFYGRTVRFNRNGHIYYAQFDKDSTDKILYGEKDISQKGKKAIIKVGADGDIFDIVENAKYDHSGKDLKNHKSKDNFTDYFDYFYKTVQIDNGVYDIVVNVKKQYGTDNGYTYTIKVRNNNKIKAAPALTGKSQLSMEQGLLDNNKIPHLSSKVNSKNENNEKFSMKSTVEETKDLIAVHNVEESGLLKSLALGGLPMPSIAVVKAESGHSEFGRISLLFNKDTIDPKLNKNNKVYSGDAWTPTVPRTSYKLNEKKTDEIRKRINSVLKGTGFDTAYGYLSLDNDNMNDFLERNDGKLKKYYKTKTPIKYAFLKESGIEVKPAYEDAALDTSNSAMENDFIIEIAEKYGKDKINDFHSESKKITDEIVDELMQLANKYIERTEPKSVYTTRTGRYKPFYNENNFGFFKADNIFNAAYKYLKYGVKQTIDTTITDNIINDLIFAHKNEYENWLDDVFGGAVEKEGIRNNKDSFTPSGNRRSFESLHYEITLENIVKAMKEQEETGNIGALGVSIWGVSTKKYKSVDEIKADKDRLKNISKEDYRKKREAFLNRLIDISNSALVDVDVIIDTIRTRKTKSGMLSYLQEYTKKATAATVDDIVSLVKDISNMPTEYFEAKPRRAVGFDEVVKAVIPNNSSDELKTALENKGVDFVEYEADNETDRLNKINEVEDIRFSEKTDDTIKEQLKSHSAELDKMDSVFSIEKSGGFSSGKNALNWVMEKLKGYGKLIARQGFGNVELDEKRVRNGCRYFEPYNKYLNEIIAFAAVPKVIKQGIEVGKHIEHKGRDYNTITFAAPITINGIRNNMAVVVRIEGKKYYKVHRVVLPDGSQLTFEQNKKDTAHSAGGVDNNSGLSQKANVFSDNNISEKTEEVKPDLFSTKEIRTDIDVDVAEEYIKINRELEK